MVWEVRAYFRANWVGEKPEGEEIKEFSVFCQEVRLLPLVAFAFHFSRFCCTTSVQVALKHLKSTVSMEQLSEALPSDPVLLTLDLLTSEGLMLFKLGDKITQCDRNQNFIHLNTVKEETTLSHKILYSQSSKANIQHLNVLPLFSCLCWKNYIMSSLEVIYFIIDDSIWTIIRNSLIGVYWSLIPIQFILMQPCQ